MVARLVRDQKVGGSNPLTPITDKDPAPAAGSLSLAESWRNLGPQSNPRGEDASEVHAERREAPRSEATRTPLTTACSVQNGAACIANPAP